MRSHRREWSHCASPRRRARPRLDRGRRRRPFRLDDGTRLDGDPDAAAALAALVGARTGLTSTVRRRRAGGRSTSRIELAVGRRRTPSRTGSPRTRHPSSSPARMPPASSTASRRSASSSRATATLDRAGRRDRGRPALRLPRGDARRRAPLPPGRDGQGLHRPRRRPEVQRAAPAPDRRPGLADPPRLAAEADRGSPPPPRSAAIQAASTRRPTTARSSSTRHPAT